MPIDLVDPAPVQPRPGGSMARPDRITRPARPARWRWRTRRRQLPRHRPLTPRRGRRRPVVECGLDLVDRISLHGFRRGAFQRGLDLVERVAPPGCPVVNDGREDRGQPVVGRKRTAGAGLRTRATVRTVTVVRAIGTCMLAYTLSLWPARLTGRLVVAPFVIQWPCGRRLAPSGCRASPLAGVPRRAHTT
jgi:hypothetical protein